jgi:hypothetical protein
MDNWTIAGVIIAIVSVIVAIVIGIIQIRQQINKTKNNNQKTIPVLETTIIPVLETTIIPVPKNKSPKSINLSPKEIYKSISELTPFQAITSYDLYKGIEVEWDLYFINIRKIEDKKVSLHLIDNDSQVSVFGDISLDDYPYIKIIKKNTNFKVFGEIESVTRTRYIDLKISRIIVLE